LLEESDADSMLEARNISCPAGCVPVALENATAASDSGPASLDASRSESTVSVADR
jgi:hypothetical protein